MVPSEIEKLMVPIPNKINIDLKSLNNLVRTEPMETVLLEHGYKILGTIGVSKEEVRKLTDIWLYLKNRRQRNGDVEV